MRLFYWPAASWSAVATTSLSASGRKREPAKCYALFILEVKKELFLSIYFRKKNHIYFNLTTRGRNSRELIIQLIMANFLCNLTPRIYFPSALYE